MTFAGPKDEDLSIFGGHHLGYYTCEEKENWAVTSRSSTVTLGQEHLLREKAPQPGAPPGQTADQVQGQKKKKVFQMCPAHTPVCPECPGGGHGHTREREPRLRETGGAGTWGAGTEGSKGVKVAPKHGPSSGLEDQDTTAEAGKPQGEVGGLPQGEVGGLRQTRQAGPPGASEATERPRQLQLTKCLARKGGGK